jgi:NMD protein affecting ribosome stability and mRNA decay
MEEYTPCYYCGDPADSIDHTIPQSVLKSLRGFDIETRQAILKRLPRMVTVEACRSCNSVLRAIAYPTLEQRRQHVVRYLMVKYAKLLASPDWDDAELAELGPTLRSAVLQQQGIKEWVRRRIRHARRSPGTASIVVETIRARVHGRSTARRRARGRLGIGGIRG